VAVVLNNIDERLKDVAFPAQGWDLDSLQPIGALLDAARQAGRAIVITADHGHVLDRNAEHRSSDGGGERYKNGSVSHHVDEVVLTGSRVLDSEGKPGGTVTMPWAEQVQYGTKRNGYHGGLTPQELLVPLAVFVSGSTGEDWPAVTFSPPDWWRHAAPIELPKAAPAPAPKRPPKQAAVDDARLFDVDAGDTGQLAVDAEWDESILSALADLRPPSVRLNDDEVRRLLRSLDSFGGAAVSEDRLADMAGLPVARIGRYVAQLQQLVNIDGYGVVTSVNGEVRLDRILLETQLGLA